VTILYSIGHFLLVWYFGTESLSPAVFEILGSKHIGITSLTFLGHATSQKFNKKELFTIAINNQATNGQKR